MSSLNGDMYPRYVSPFFSFLAPPASTATPSMARVVK